MPPTQADRKGQRAQTVVGSQAKILATTSDQKNSELAFTPEALKQRPSAPTSITTSGVKRSADDTAQDDVERRPKFKQTLSTTIYPSPIFTLPPSAYIATPPLTPVTADSSILHTGDDSANGFTHHTGSDHTARDTFIQSSEVASPQILPDVIEALQRASAELLDVLVDKGSVDREKRLSVAFGTLRMFIDVELVNCMKELQKGFETSREVPTAVSESVPAVSRTFELPASTPKGPRSESAGLTLPSSSKNLQEQLANAQAAIDRQKRVLKGQSDHSKQKNNDIARLEDDNKRLNARLVRYAQQSRMSSEQSDSQSDTVGTLTRLVDNREKEIEILQTKFDRVQSHNIRLRDLLHSEGIPAGLDDEVLDEGGTENIEVTSETEETEERDEVKQEQEQETPKIWKIKGRANARAQSHPLSQSSREGSETISRSDSILATPMSRVLHVRDPTYSDTHNRAPTGAISCEIDHRSPWERSLSGGNNVPTGHRQTSATTPIGPRLPAGKAQRRQGVEGAYYSKSRVR